MFHVLNSSDSHIDSGCTLDCGRFVWVLGLTEVGISLIELKQSQIFFQCFSLQKVSYELDFHGVTTIEEEYCYCISFLALYGVCATYMCYIYTD